MSERDRLIELLFKVTEEKDCPKPDEIADYLLANGVIVPPCKVGDTVYVEVYNEIKSFVVVSIELAYTAKKLESECVAHNGECPLLFKFENIGKTVFLTEEEAEQALATDTNVGGKKENSSGTL